MIKVKGIGNIELSWDYENPPKTFRKVGSRADSDGNFDVEVYKLTSFNKLTKEALYKKAKNEKLKALKATDIEFNFVTAKNRNNYEEEEF